MTRDTSQRDANRDPITGTPGAHPVGVGVGGVAGGLAAGAAAGTVFGPIGTLIGAAAGTVIGAAAGKGVAERIDPTGEVDYWRDAHRTRPYYSDQYDFQRDYAGVYRAGAVLRGGGGFSGNPRLKHIAIPGIDRPEFERWLALFRDVLEEIARDPAAPELIHASARTIAESLLQGIHIHRDGHLPSSEEGRLHA